MLKALFSFAFTLIAGYTLLAQNCFQNSAPPPTKVIAPPIRDISFIGGNNLLDDSKQNDIAHFALTRMIPADTVDREMPSIAEEIAERTRTAFRGEGYFSAKVTSEAVKVSERPPQYEIRVVIDDHPVQFRLGDLNVVNAISFPTEELRELFPLQRGDIFSREKIVDGLDAIRRFYGSHGYINFTPVPDTHLDEDSATANLTIDVDEGKQFRVRSIEVIGVGEDLKRQVLEELDLRPGDVYTSEAWQRVLLKFPNLVNSDDPDREQKKLDERNGLVDLVLHMQKLLPCRSH